MFYWYKVTYYCDYDCDEHTDEGIVYGTSYSMAAEHIVEDYGKEYVCDLYLRDIVVDGHCISCEEIEAEMNHE